MADPASSRVATGVGGLDELLGDGLLAGQAYMLRGGPGTGKTILGMHFLTALPPEQRTGLYVGFEEPEPDIRRNAERLGFDLAGVSLLDLSPEPSRFLEKNQYAVFQPIEVEGDSVTDRIGTAVDSVEPDRVFVDPLTQLRNLAPDDYQFRQEVAALMGYLKAREITAVFSTQPMRGMPDDDLQFLGDGTIELERTDAGRRVAVSKFRGSDYRSGWHTLRIRTDGLQVFPSLVPEKYDGTFEPTPQSSGVDTLDRMLWGGIERGTVTVISGPSGVGKSTLGTQFLAEAAGRGQRVAAFLFEESQDSFEYRSERIGIPVRTLRSDGRFGIEEVEALTQSPDEFGRVVKGEVETHGTETVLIDGTAGYRLSLRGAEPETLAELHTLCRYLRNCGVTTILIEEQNQVTGTFAPTEREISYLADTLIFLRYLEMRGEMRKAVGILKKRLSGFEPTLRELKIDEEGIHVGEQLTNLRGILTGTPEWTDEEYAGGS